MSGTGPNTSAERQGESNEEAEAERLASQDLDLWKQLEAMTA